MPSEIINRFTVKKLVDAFYEKVRRDADLGPIFKNAIGTQDEAWKPHLLKMYCFWSTLMSKHACYEGDFIQYKGTPMQQHQALPKFDPGLFDRWLELFSETVHEQHKGDAARHYIEASTRVAESLKLGMFGDAVLLRN